MASVVDILETRLTLSGVEAYQAGLDRSAGSMAKWGAISTAAAVISAKSADIIGRAYQEAAGDAEAFSRAAGNFKGSFPAAEVESVSGNLQKLTAVADDQIAGFLGLLGTYKLTGEEAKSLALPILNASRALEAQGVTVESLATQIGKAVQGGNVSALRRSGIFVDEAKFAVDRLGAVREALQAQGGNAALDFAQSGRGAMVAFKLAVDDLNGALGREFLPTLTAGIKSGTDFVNWVAGSGPVVKTAAIALGTTFVAATVVAQTGIVAMIIQLRLLAKAHQDAAAAAVQHGSAEVGAMGKGGIAGKAGLLLGRAGLGAAAAGLINMVPTGGNRQGEGVKSVLEGTALGAGIGAGIGGLFAGVGAVPGALIGGAVGAAGGLAADAMKSKDKPAETEAQKQTKLLEEQNALLKKIASPTDYAGLSVRHQFAALELGTLIS